MNLKKRIEAIWSINYLSTWQKIKLLLRNLFK